MFVPGAPRVAMLSDIRKIIPDHFLLVPGIGAQGGSLEKTFESGANKDIGLLVNSSRDIIFEDGTERFAEAAGMKAEEMQCEMNALIRDIELNKLLD